jgi:hypothetical protein
MARVVRDLRARRGMKTHRVLPSLVTLATFGLAACDVSTVAAPAASDAELNASRSPVQLLDHGSTGAAWSMAVHRDNGAPRSVSYSVAVTPGTYNLIVMPLDGPPPHGTIMVNGKTVVGPSNFAPGRNRPLTYSLSLQATNTITIRLTGAPGSGVLLRLVDMRPVMSDTVRWLAHCASDGSTPAIPLVCFDATLTTTQLDGNRTRVTLLLRNLQGSLPQSLPLSAITSVSVLARRGPGPVPVSPLTVITSGTSSVIGTVAPVLGTGSVAYPPYPGGPRFDGLDISNFNLAGCAVPPTLQGGVWQTCGSAAQGVLFAFEVSGQWSANDLFIYLAMVARPTGLPQPSCATGPVPLGPCRPLN